MLVAGPRRGKYHGKSTKHASATTPKPYAHWWDEARERVIKQANDQRGLVDQQEATHTERRRRAAEHEEQGGMAADRDVPPLGAGAGT